MNAQANSSLNGGSGGLSSGSGPQKISVGAGGLHAPAYNQERLKLLLVVVVLAAVNLAAAERDQNPLK